MPCCFTDGRETPAARSFDEVDEGGAEAPDPDAGAIAAEIERGIAVERQRRGNQLRAFRAGRGAAGECHVLVREIDGPRDVLGGASGETVRAARGRTAVLEESEAGERARVGRRDVYIGAAGDRSRGIPGPRAAGGDDRHAAVAADRGAALDREAAAVDDVSAGLQVHGAVPGQAEAAAEDPDSGAARRERLGLVARERVVGGIAAGVA